MSLPDLSDDQRRSFAEHGLVRLPGLLPGTVVDPVRHQVYELLERRGVWRDGRWSGSPADDALTLGLRRSIRDRMKVSDACRELETEALEAAVLDVLGGVPFRTMKDRPQFLFTPPDSETWSVPNKVWHLDVPRLRSGGCPGVQAFCCIDTVVAGGGGTVVVAGSHRFLNEEGRMASREVKRVLARLPWFQMLFRPGDEARSARLLAGETLETPEGGVPVQVVELTGAPGDVYLLDLRVLHSLAPNVSGRPRLMVTQRYFRDSVADEIYAAQAEEAEPA